MKKFIFLALGAGCSFSWAANPINLHKAPLSALNQFSLIQQTKTVASPTSNTNTLKWLNQTQQNDFVITRYQQLYKGIPIIGAQVTVSRNQNVRGFVDGQDEVNGRLLTDIQLNTTPALDTQQAMQIAKNHYTHQADLAKPREEKSELQIRANKDNQLTLIYLVSFKSMVNNKPVWPFFVIDAQSGTILKQWDNIQYYTDSGPGGNEKVHEYWYGKDGLPGLEVTAKGPAKAKTCILDDEKVVSINLNSEWDDYDIITTPIHYPCNHNVGDIAHGAYSPGNDAYFFGHIIVDFYKDWYGLNALQDNAGNPQKLVMRVHFGEWYDNAFWNGETMNFGDGNFLYPFVSLDVATHEVSHGFTQHHSNLEYHDESGALNEAFSDMAGLTSRAYLLEKFPEFYNKSSVTPNEITWKIGETLIPSSFHLEALRFLDIPSKDQNSADCVDKKMARQQSICAISYPELLDYAEASYPDEKEKQSYIVHTGSGVFNRVFYLMSKEMGIKTAFQVMLIANTKYWNPLTDFAEGACGVIYATKDLNLTVEPIITAFAKVGIATTHCINE